MKRVKKLIALMLALTMLVSMLPMAALAVDADALPDKDATENIDSDSSDEEESIDDEETSVATEELSVGAAETDILGEDSDEVGAEGPAIIEESLEESIPDELGETAESGEEMTNDESDSAEEVTADETIHENEASAPELDAVADQGSIVDSGTCGDNLTWTLGNGGTLTITGTGDMSSYSEGDTPWKYYSQQIVALSLPSGLTGIGAYAFFGCEGLTEIVLPDTVTYIGPSAFACCSGLTDVTLPSGLTTVSDSAFAGCSALTSLVLPDSITYLSPSALPQNASAAVGLPFGDHITCTLTAQRDIDTMKNVATVTFRGTGVLDYTPFYNQTPALFSSYDRLTVVIEPGITGIDGSGFCGWRNLVSVTVPEGVTEIGAGIFEYCTALEEVSLPESVTAIGQYAFGDCYSLESISLPSRLTSIGANAFENCSGLTSLSIPEGVTAIEDETFDNCSLLRWVSLPEGLTRIGKSAFENTGLETIALPSGLTEIGSAAFKHSALTAVEIPAGVKTLGGTFVSCGNLKQVTLQEGLEQIGGSTFYGCRMLTEIGLPASLTEIGGYAFYQSGLTSIDIPEGVTAVGGWAFSECTSLTRASFPGSVADVDMYIFKGCTQLKQVTLGEGITSVGGGMFWLCSSLREVTIPAGVTVIQSDAFRGCTDLASVTLPEGLVKIGHSAFLGCESLTQISFPSSLTEIGPLAFSGAGLTQVFLPKGVASIGEGEYDDSFDASAFGKCPDLTAIEVESGHPAYAAVDGILYNKARTELLLCPDGREQADGIPATVKTIHERAFADCAKLTHVTIPASVTAIGSSAFSGCESLKTITIPDSVTEIGSGAFSSSGLQTVTLPSSITRIEGGVFSICKSLTSVTIPDSVTEIGSSAFYLCTALRHLTLPDSIKTIEENAFRGSALWDITIPAGVTTIGKDAFVDCADLKELTVLGTDTVIGSHAYGYSFGQRQYAYYRYSGNALYGYTDSTAEAYAAANGITFVSLGSALVDIASCTVTVSDITYVSDNYMPPVKAVNSSGVALKEGEDYTLSYSGSAAAGTGTVTITGIGNYTGTVTRTYRIGAASVKDAVILGVVSKSYTGKALTQTIVVTVDQTDLMPGRDYTVSYQNNTNIGIATLTVTGKGNYTGTVSKTFKISLATPTLTKAEVVNGGIKVTWDKVPGATKYRLYCKVGTGGWKNVGETTGTSLTATTYDGKDGFQNGVIYTFTVKAISPAVSGYNSTGISIAHFNTPKLSGVSNVDGGVKITWGKVTGASKYRVFRKTGSGGWTKVGDTASTSFTDKTAKSATQYTYTVRCITANANAYTSGYDTKGKTITHLSAPVISGVSNVNGGVKITWGKVTGAVKYRVFRKTGSGSWTKVADTTAVNYTDKTAVSGTKYVYTVRCISSDGKSYTSAYDTTGKTITYVAAPVLSSVTNVNGGVTIKWGKVTGAEKYRVFCKTGSGGWKQVGDTTSTSLTVKTSDGKTALKSGTKYTFTVRCISKDGKSYTSAYDTTGKTIVYVAVPNLSSVTNSASKKMTVKWAKDSTVTGYQIQYSTSSTFASGNKTITVAGANNVSKVIDSLTKNSTYYIRIRSYKTVSGTNYYSAWSGKKSVKISK